MKQKSTVLVEKYNLEYGASNHMLRIVCDPITEFSTEIKQLAQDMMKLERLYNGTWLAAPQIWFPIQLIATIQRKKKGNKMVETGETILINPFIIQQSEEVFVSEESCLSLPDFIWYVQRYKKITVEYQDIMWNKKIKEFSDYNAAVVQHEIDHLHGILFIDKLITKKKPQKK
jgi:peptide deformylase